MLYYVYIPDDFFCSFKSTLLEHPEKETQKSKTQIISTTPIPVNDDRKRRKKVQADLAHPV